MDAVTDGEFRRMSFIATIGVRDAELGPLTGFQDAGHRRGVDRPCGNIPTARSAG